jgi:hypothetical protein
MARSPNTRKANNLGTRRFERIVATKDPVTENDITTSYDENGKITSVAVAIKTLPKVQRKQED